MITITLTGGRGTVTGELVHMNPNYWVVLDNGTERFVPTFIIADSVRH